MNFTSKVILKVALLIKQFYEIKCVFKSRFEFNTFYFKFRRTPLHYLRFEIIGNCYKFFNKFLNASNSHRADKWYRVSYYT